jgi:hypothetical protein
MFLLHPVDVEVPRKVPPPDFRYVWLLPGPTQAAVTLAVGMFAFGAFGVALWSTGHQPMSLAVTLMGATLTALAFARREGGRVQVPFGAREVPMAVVPWGIIVTPDTEPRVLRWPAIRHVDVAVSHTLRGGTPSAVSTVVTIRTDREVLAGRTFGSAGLDGLMVNLRAYAEESSRAISLDLEGFERAGDGATEPVVADVLRRAEELCSTSDGAFRLSLPPGGYRSVASRAAAPETLEMLRRALAEGGTVTPADPRPLAAVLAVLLDAKSLVPDLLRLVSSPHPIVAGVAKAAAMRLGAQRSRAGSVDECSAFLFQEDVEALQRWIDRSEPS